VRQALKRADGNQTRAAHLLGISRDSLRYRMQKLASEGEAGAGYLPRSVPPPYRECR